MGQCCWWKKAQEGHNKGVDHIDARGLEVSNLQYLLVCDVVLSGGTPTPAGTSMLTM